MEGTKDFTLERQGRFPGGSGSNLGYKGKIQVEASHFRCRARAKLEGLVVVRVVHGQAASATPGKVPQMQITGPAPDS